MITASISADSIRASADDRALAPVIRAATASARPTSISATAHTSALAIDLEIVSTWSAPMTPVPITPIRIVVMLTESRRLLSSHFQQPQLERTSRGSFIQAYNHSERARFAFAG